jgi:hypothetical protein
MTHKFLIGLFPILLACSGAPSEPMNQEVGQVKQADLLCGSLTTCGLSCVNLNTDSNNCGACSYACVNGRTCSGAVCTPAWQSIDITNAPGIRASSAAATFNNNYVIFGGSDYLGGTGMVSTASYNPSTDDWTTLADMQNARCGHNAVSAGANGIVAFGGLYDCMSGASTTPGLEVYTSDQWTELDLSNEPDHRYTFGAAWTGLSLFLYGGSTYDQPAVASGARWIPDAITDLLGTSTWSDASCGLTDCERGGFFQTFKEGNNIRVWGGGPYGDAPNGLSFALLTDTWSGWTVPTNTDTKLPTGNIRFADDGRRIFYLYSTDLITIYDRQSGTWVSDDTSTMPSGFCIEAPAAWVGSELIAWSGQCDDGGPSYYGGRYQPPAP